MFPSGSAAAQACCYYIRGLELLGQATVRRVRPPLLLGSVRPVADATMLNAIIANRYELMATYASRLQRAALAEWLRLRAEGHAVAELANLRSACRWLHRYAGHVPTGQRAQVSSAVAQSQILAELVGVTKKPFRINQRAFLEVVLYI